MIVATPNTTTNHSDSAYRKMIIQTEEFSTHFIFMQVVHQPWMYLFDFQVSLGKDLLTGVLD